MSEMTPEDVHEAILDGVSDCHPDNHSVDSDGEIVVHTGIYRWQDGSYHEEHETKTFLVTLDRIVWDKEVDGEIQQVDLPTTLTLEVEARVNATTSEVWDLGIDRASDMTGFCIHSCEWAMPKPKE